MSQRGSTLIEMMIVVSLLAIGVAAWLSSHAQVHTATEALLLREGLVLAVADELERARSCRTLGCLEAWKGGPERVDGFADAVLVRAVGEGMGGTYLVTVEARGTAGTGVERGATLTAVDRSRR